MIPYTGWRALDAWSLCGQTPYNRPDSLRASARQRYNNADAAVSNADSDWDAHVNCHTAHGYGDGDADSEPADGYSDTDSAVLVGDTNDVGDAAHHIWHSH
eukprot:Hpha_TRINITY_DN16716_c0_g5::TRINITY_DN16716_c0_g5_i3::g.77907::m.77907